MRQLKIVRSITPRENTCIEKYLIEVSKYSLISVEEEIDLAKKIKEWDTIALQKLIKANLRFVISVAKQYQNQWLSLPDLINEWNLWLMKATKKFDETRWFKFISYAVRWIRQSILMAISENSRMIRLPQNQLNQKNVIDKAIAALEQKLNREPSIDEINKRTGIKKETVNKLLRNVQKTTSLDFQIISEKSDDFNLYDKIPNVIETTDNNLNIEWFKYEIAKILKTLSKNEAEIIKLFFGLNGYSEMSHQEIAEKLWKSTERIRQIKNEAIKKMKYKSKLLKKYLW